jgi:fructoselysine 6-kinase
MKIASVGDNCVDLYEGQHQTVYIGGNAVNLAVAVKRSGVDCSYIGLVGEDSHGILVKEALTQEGIDVSNVLVKPGKTAWTKVLLKGNDRHFIEEDLGVQREFSLSEEQLKFIAGHDLVHYTAFTNWPTAYLGEIKAYDEMVKAHVSRFHQDQVPVSMDFSDADLTGLLERTAGNLSIGFFSRSGLSEDQITLEARKLFTYGFQLVILTRGQDGSCAYDGRELLLESSSPVKVVDPLGAGDAFIGAFLSQYVQQIPVRECLRHASRYAAEVCTRFGGF